jgi:polysaccharide deacetylase family protein (PEP-CTERM system associated)
MRHVMSIDLEDWFCVQNLNAVIPHSQWEQCESRVEASTLKLLDLFDRHKVEATFFVLGWVAERYPDLVREVERRGHEISSHGYSHKLITHMEREEFRIDLDRSLEVLAKIVSQPVVGFRAPSFSVTAKTLWATEILQAAGLRYDSSVFPVGFHPDYGIPTAPLSPYHHENGLLELPMSCAEVAGRRIPCSGGGYFRIFPYALTRMLLRNCERAGRPVMFYLHPWEVDPGQPRVAALKGQKRFRHYCNLERTMSRMETLLSEFSFGPVRRIWAAETGHGR